MILISAKTEAEAEDQARHLGCPPTAYIYIPELDPLERIERLKGIYGQRPEDLIGNFSYIEIQTVTQKIG